MDRTETPALVAVERALGWHAHFRAEQAALQTAITALDADERLMAPWRHFTRGMDEHLRVEEEVVFPAITALARGREPADVPFEQPLMEMRYELDEMRTIADALRNAAVDAGPAIEARLLALLDELEVHASKEEEVLFPLAMALLEAWTQGVEAPAPQTSQDADRVRVRATESVCNECVRPVPAEVVRTDDEVWLEKHCPEHGVTRQLLSRSPEYWAGLDDYYFEVNAENYPQRDYMVRMTERCNLDCPICLAKANTEDTPDLDLSNLEQLLSERRGIKVDLLAAEPTLREDLEGIIGKVKASGNIAALHTNGLKLANRDYAQRIKDAGVDEVFLQFDGFDDEAHKVLRGRKLLKARLKALENLRELGIGTSLIVVIARGLNEEQVGETLRFALRPENTHIREVFFLGLRVLGSVRDAKGQGDASLSDMAMMPDELIGLLTEQVPGMNRTDIQRFNKVYFALLSAFRIKKCLYVQHYLVARQDGGTPISELLDLPAMEKAAERYAARLPHHPRLARAEFVAALARHAVNRKTARMLMDLVKLQDLFRQGMQLNQVPDRFLILGFITACDPLNFDAQVAVNCGKGELSMDGGFIDSGAVANVRREARFDESDKRPGARRPQDGDRCKKVRVDRWTWGLLGA